MRRPFWYIPSHKDSRHLGSEVGSRVATFEYLRQVGQAVELLGYEGVLVPTGTNCEDAWVIASLLAGLTARLKFIVAVRPGLMAPSTAARMAATFDRMSAGRLIVNVVGGGDPVELAGDGVFLEHDSRYALMDEFLRIWRPLVAGEEFSFDGKYLKIANGNVLFPCVQEPHPPLFMGGSSEAAKQIAAEHIDTLLSRAAGRRCREAGVVSRSGAGEGPANPLWNSPARYRARNRRRGLGGRRRSHKISRR